MNTEIRQADDAASVELARTLFREYETWLGLDLCFQGFEGELRELPGKYSPPDGRLVVAYADGKPAGCGALRQIEPGISEMKRIFVRDEFRGSGLGRQLIADIIEFARSRGYSSIRLDTYPPKMGKAVAIYRSLGFHEIEPYYDNPHSDVLFLELALK